MLNSEVDPTQKSNAFLENGFLFISFPKWVAIEFCNLIFHRMKVLSNSNYDTVGYVHNFHQIHRLSRMGYELMTTYRLSNLDKMDASLLYNLDHTDKTNFIWSMINPIRDQIKETSGSIVTADHFAKNLSKMLTD